MSILLVATLNTARISEYVLIRGAAKTMNNTELAPILSDSGLGTFCRILNAYDENTKTLDGSPYAVYEWVTEPKPCLRLVSPRS